MGTERMEAYASSRQHLLAELERIDLLIRAAVARARQLLLVDEDFQGLYVSEQEVDALLAAPAGLPPWAAVDGPSAEQEVGAALERLAGALAERRSASLRQGVELRLDRLARLFDLSAFEVDVLLICLAPEIDLRYERLFAYLQDDVTKRRPSVDLVLNLLGPTFEAKLAARARFAPAAPLLRHRLLELFEDPSRPQPTLLARYLKADERIVAYLFGSDDPDPRLRPYARQVEPAARSAEPYHPAELGERLAALTAAAGANGVLYLQGAYGVGKRSAAEALCRERGLALLAIDVEGLLAAGDGTLETVVELAGREARLRGAALYWRRFDLLLADDQRARRSSFLDRLEAQRGLTFLSGKAAWEPSGALRGVTFLRFELPLPDHRQRRELWSQALAGLPLDGGLDLSQLAGRFRFSGGQIRDAAATAASLARRRAPADGRVTSDDLFAACRLQSNQKLSALARKITPRYAWDDIVLPADRRRQLREVANAVRYRSRVYETWGFDRKLALGKGLNVLFAGPSGTGKTMAAEILAGELGLDLYKIDLSTVVSKYIGETEKNLARIFAEAETSNAILFFDEADALFGKRSEVRDAHDRYANIEISYLLQKMEEYEGMVILASNLSKNMDDAFVRRLHFTVDFPFPDEDDRGRIWAGIWPAETPRSPDLDLGFLARGFEIPGGTIRNVAVAAAFLAAGDGAVVEMDHLVHALRRELRKMGQVVSDGQFAPELAGETVS